MSCVNFFPLIELKYPWMDIIYCSNKTGISMLFFIFIDVSADWMELKGHFRVMPLNLFNCVQVRCQTSQSNLASNYFLIVKMLLKIKTRNHVTCTMMCYLS